MRTQKELDELAETPFVKIQAEEVRKRVFESEVAELAKDMNFSHKDALHCTVVHLSILLVIATFEASESMVENSILKDENAALRKRLIPDGMPPDNEYPGEEPKMPWFEWIALVLAILTGVAICLWLRIQNAS